MATSATLTSAPEIVDATRSTPARVLSIDVLRGLTIALMILVNDAGDSNKVFTQLEHVEWNGWTLTDLVFPTFLFLVGTSLVFSMASRAARGDSTRTLAGHVAVRAGKIILLDWVLTFFPRMDFHHLRLFGVLTRIGLCYFAAGIILLGVVRIRRQAWTLVGAVAALLVAYWILMRWVPVPGLGLPGRDVPFLDPQANLAAWMDRGVNAWTQHWLHTGSLYNHGVRDPEGLLSTLPSIATTLLGALAGLGLRAASQGRLLWTRLRLWLLAAGVAGVLAGEAWNRWFPINKNLWTSSYVLLAAGLATIALALCSWLVDARPEPWPRALRGMTWSWFVFGSNAIAAYITSVVLVKAAFWFHASGADGVRRNLYGFIYQGVFARHGSNGWTSLCFSLFYVALCFLPVWWLWRRRIFLKL